MLPLRKDGNDDHEAVGTVGSLALGPEAATDGSGNGIDPGLWKLESAAAGCGYGSGNVSWMWLCGFWALGSGERLQSGWIGADSLTQLRPAQAAR